jgi:hypothetical protein
MMDRSEEELLTRAWRAERERDEAIAWAEAAERERDKLIAVRVRGEPYPSTIGDGDYAQVYHHPDAGFLSVAGDTPEEAMANAVKAIRKACGLDEWPALASKHDPAPQEPDHDHDQDDDQQQVDQRTADRDHEGPE